MTKNEYAKLLQDYKPALTSAEAAEILRISTKTLYKLIRQGDIPAAKAGRGYRIAKTELIDYLRNREKKNTNPKGALSKKSSCNRWTSQNTCDIVRVAKDKYLIKGALSNGSYEKHTCRKRTG